MLSDIQASKEKMKGDGILLKGFACKSNNDRMNNL